MSLRSPRPLLSRRGISLVEVVITMTIMGIIVVSVVPFFQTTFRGYSSFEVRNSIGVVNQRALNRIMTRLTECKRIFDGDPATGGNAYLDLLGSAQGRPLELAGNELPVIRETGSLTPGATGFAQTAVGNRLFFAGNDRVRDLPVAGGTVTIDTYRFHFYTVGPRPNAKLLGGKPVATLWEWHSAPYADYFQLSGLVGSTQTAAAAGLWAQGVRWAWDTSASTSSAGSAFYALTSGGAVNLDAGHNLRQESSLFELKTQDMLNTLTGRMSGGFTQGLCPNGLLPDVSPKFAAAGADFPAGFEVLIVGSAVARQVAMRSAVAAKGGFKGILSNEQVLVVAARDIW
jgi:hypothetical protein